MAKPAKPIVEQLRQAIRQAERRGITRYRIAKLCDVTQGELSRIFHGQCCPRLDTAERIADAIGYIIKIERQ